MVVSDNPRKFHANLHVATIRAAAAGLLQRMRMAAAVLGTPPADPPQRWQGGSAANTSPPAFHDQVPTQILGSVVRGSCASGQPMSFWISAGSDLTWRSVR